MKKINFKAAYFLLIIIFLVGISTIFAQTMFPQVKSVFPPDQASNIGTTVEIAVEFSSDMDKKSVEGGFYIFPKTKGQFRWQANKLFFKPHKPLWPYTSYFVSFSPLVKDIHGFPLSLIHFTTATQGLYIGSDGFIYTISEHSTSESQIIQGNNPIWGQNNSSIIYDYEGIIWQTDINGQNKVKLVEDESNLVSLPTLSPLMDLVAYVGTNSADIDNIYYIDLKTKIIKQLTGFFEPNTIDQIRWSPDGLYLAFLRAGQIWIVNQDGSDMRKLNTSELKCKVNFAWSPGGTQIAFVAEDNIWIGNIYSSELKKVSFDNPQTGSLDWSVNNKIAFEAEGLTIMDADGSNEIHIATAGKNPQWINSGDYLSFTLPLNSKDNKDQLWMMSADGLKKDKIAIINSQYRNVSWSPRIDPSQSALP